MLKSFVSNDKQNLCLTNTKAYVIYYYLGERKSFFMFFFIKKKDRKKNAMVLMMLRKSLAYIILWLSFQFLADGQMIPKQRQWHTATHIDNKLYILGGV